MGPPTPEIVQCPHCRAENPVVDDRCRSCERPLAFDIGPAPGLPRRFGLGSSMVLIALIAIGLGLTRQLPGLGIPFLLISVPALVRTFGWIASRHADGRPLSAIEKGGAFLDSFCLVLVMVVAAGVVFTAVGLIGLWAGGLIGGLLVGLPLGIAAAAYVLRSIAWMHWKQWD